MKRLVLAAALMFAALPVLAQPNPVQGQPEAIEQGNAVYDSHCTACHGGAGGAGERAPAIVNSSTTSPLRGERSDAQLLAIVRNGIPGTAMPAWRGRLSEDDINKLGAYIHAQRGTALDNPVAGDPTHGEAVFWGKGDCGGCHMIGGRGGVTAPDLSNIAILRKTGAITDALTKAGHRVYGDGGVHLPMIPPMDYDPVTVVTRDGRHIDGVMRNQDAWSVQFMSMDGKLHSFARSALKSVTIRPGSVMPSDYDKRLSKDEFNDLMAFLTRRGARPDTTAAVAE